MFCFSYLLVIPERADKLPALKGLLGKSRKGQGQKASEKAGQGTALSPKGKTTLKVPKHVVNEEEKLETLKDQFLSYLADNGEIEQV